MNAMTPLSVMIKQTLPVRTTLDLTTANATQDTKNSTVNALISTSVKPMILFPAQPILTAKIMMDHGDVTVTPDTGITKLVTDVTKLTSAMMTQIFVTLNLTQNAAI
jgi:hypothetical protein